MATAKQSEVTWVKKGETVNGKKATRGYLALRSDKSKAFSGTVTGVAAGTTKNMKGTAEYKGGRNVAAVAARKAAKSGNTASTTSSSSYAKSKAASSTSKNIGYTPGTGSRAQTKTAGSYTVATGRGASSAAGSKPAVATSRTTVNTKVGTVKRFPDGYKRWDGKRWVKTSGK